MNQTIFFDWMLGNCHSTNNCVIICTHTICFAKNTRNDKCRCVQIYQCTIPHVTIVSLVVSSACCQCRCHFHWTAHRIAEIGPSENADNPEMFSGDLITWESANNRIFIISSIEKIMAQNSIALSVWCKFFFSTLSGALIFSSQLMLKKWFCP